MVDVVALEFKDETVGNAILLAPTNYYSGSLEIFIMFVIVVFIITFIVVNILMSYMLSKRIIKPLSLLKTAVGGISKGDLSLEIIEVGDEEIVDLCADFEKMRVQLKDSIRLKKKYDDNRTIRNIIPAYHRNLFFLIFYVPLHKFYKFPEKNPYHIS